MVRSHPPPHCENTQVLREVITEEDDDDDLEVRSNVLSTAFVIICTVWISRKAIEWQYRDSLCAGWT